MSDTDSSPLLCTAISPFLAPVSVSILLAKSFLQGWALEGLGVGSGATPLPGNISQLTSLGQQDATEACI